MSQQSTVADKAKALILAQGGLIRTREAISLGIHPRTLYSLRDSGELEELSRGIYQLKGWKQLEYPDLITVALRVPNGVLCLVSALSFHEMTTQVPHSVSSSACGSSAASSSGRSYGGFIFNLDSAIGRARVGRWRRGCVGATTTQATACKEVQRPQTRCQWLNWVRSAVTQLVNRNNAEIVCVHRHMLKK